MRQFNGLAHSAGATESMHWLQLLDERKAPLAVEANADR